MITLSRVGDERAMSPFAVIPGSAAGPYMKAAMRGGCDPYNSIDAVEDALFADLEREDAAVERWEREHGIGDNRMVEPS